jgi:hypothetical protein
MHHSALLIWQNYHLDFPHLEHDRGKNVTNDNQQMDSQIGIRLPADRAKDTTSVTKNSWLPEWN